MVIAMDEDYGVGMDASKRLKALDVRLTNNTTFLVRAVDSPLNVDKEGGSDMARRMKRRGTNVTVFSEAISELGETAFGIRVIVDRRPSTTPISLLPLPSPVRFLVSSSFLGTSWIRGAARLLLSAGLLWDSLARHVAKEVERSRFGVRVLEKQVLRCQEGDNGSRGKV